MNKSLFLSLEQALKKDSRFISNDENQILLKNVIRQSAEQLDETLISLMLDDKNLRETFFKPISDVIVFDSKKFITFLNNKEFLPDSYTAFKNKVGLSNTKWDYLSDSDEVVLSFPYKDCVLAGWQDKEDIKRQEVFYNEVLGRDEIDRLLDPKTFTNFKKYTNAWEEKLSGFTRGDDETIKDNLIIKGNNLLALHSLKKEFAGKVKLIYIDPPYNTWNDSFNYNDRFNHSTWLTFMKNRLEVARDLLRDDGGIFLHVDHHEIWYLNVLLDSVFWMGNKVQIISIKTASPAWFKTVNPWPIDVTEYVLFYTKNKASFNFKKGYVPVAYNKNYNLFLEKKWELKDWKFTPIKHKILEYVWFDSEKEAKDKYWDLWKTVYEAILGDFAYKNAENIVLKNVTYSYRDKKENISFKLQPINLKIEKGEVIFIRGGNGSGKSTFMNLLSGLYIPKGGEILFNNIVINENNRPNYRDMISCVFSESYLFTENYDDFDLSPSNSKLTDLLEKMALDKVIKLDQENNKVFQRLSSGQQKRLALIYAVLEDKDIFIFDEWAAEQDPDFRKYFYEVIIPDLKSKGKTVIAITHDDAYFKFCDRLIKFNYGEMLESKINEDLVI